MYSPFTKIHISPIKHVQNHIYIVENEGTEMIFFNLLFLLKFSFERKPFSFPLSKTSKSWTVLNSLFLFPHILKIVLLLTIFCLSIIQPLNEDSGTTRCHGYKDTVLESTTVAELIGVFCKGPEFSPPISEAVRRHSFIF